ncbi:MAG: 30S ribosomal protein S6e [Candidatus Heimdallarchaeota archaeon LC_2]|nr:MAG: 30S ribosomal protein S6e [Candidatus Heimdallarchaeota archaeon LC_2]
MVAEKTIVNIGQKDGSTVRMTIEGDDRTPLYGLSIGNEFSGELFNSKYKDYTFKVTGGSDSDGVPMRGDIEGVMRKRPLLSGGVGYNPKRKGVRMRKLIRGSEIFDDIAQLNVMVLKAGKKPLSEA